jgi:WD40 repeat protein
MDDLYLSVPNKSVEKLSLGEPPCAEGEGSQAVWGRFAQDETSHFGGVGYTDMRNPYLVCSDRELRALPTQWLLAERWDKVGSLLNDLKFMEEKTRRLGIDELLQDYTMVLPFFSDENNWHVKLIDAKRILDRQAHYLRQWNVYKNKPTNYFLQQLRDCSFEIGYSDLQNLIEIQLANAKLPYLRERFPINRESKTIVRTLDRHSSWLESVAITKDGHWAVSASADHTLKVWDLVTGREVHTLRGHEHIVTNVAITLDGSSAVSSSDDNTFKVWDLATGQIVRTVKRAAESSILNDVDGFSVTEDGRWAVVGVLIGIQVWDLKQGQVIRSLMGHRKTVTSVTVTPDGHWTASASWDKTIKIWDLITGQLVNTLEGHKGNVTCVSITADGHKLVSSSYDKTVKVWDLVTGKVTLTLKGRTGSVDCVAVSADGQWAASSSSATIKVWDLETGKAVRTLEGHTDAVSGLAITADGSLLISSSRDKTLKVWDLTLKDFDAPLKGHRGEVNSVDVTGDGRWVVSVSNDAIVKVWDVQTGRVVRLALKDQYTFHDRVAVTADGRWVAVLWHFYASSHSGVDIYDIKTGKKERTLSFHSGFPGPGIYRVTDMAMMADGRWIACALETRQIRVCDIKTGHVVQTLKGPMAEIKDVAISADGKWVVSAFADTTIKVWDLVKGEAVHTLQGHTKAVTHVRMTADCLWVVSVSDDNTLRVWDPRTGETIRILKYTGRIYDIAISADGRWIVSVSNDKLLKVVNLTTGKVMLSFPGAAEFRCCVIMPDGKTIVAGDEVGAVHFIEWVKH